jgi:predicted carbohydrate-binding protein with CBM5 and CBM33 domain
MTMTSTLYPEFTMFKHQSTRTLSAKMALLLATGLTAVSVATGAAATPAPATHGAVASAQSADKTIAISPATKWVNVDDSDTVTFVMGTQHFTWHFDAARVTESFKLSAIAPQGWAVGDIVVYVDSNPLYRG